VQSFGLVTKEDIGKSIEEVQRIRKTTGHNKILVDTTKQEKMPDTISIFQLFSNFPKEFMCALLLNRYQDTEDDLSFVENVGANRGVRLQLFYDKEKALEWLTDK